MKKPIQILLLLIIPVGVAIGQTKVEQTKPETPNDAKNIKLPKDAKPIENKSASPDQAKLIPLPKNAKPVEQSNKVAEQPKSIPLPKKENQN